MALLTDLTICATFDQAKREKISKQNLDELDWRIGEINSRKDPINELKVQICY